jgi:hypothetical protein
MYLLQNNPRSPYNSEDDENQVDSDTQDKSPGWVRGCWFPPSSKEETVYNDEHQKYLFKAPSLQ